MNASTRRLGWTCGLCLVVLLLVGGIGCAPLEYDTLCFFFDGVPKPVKPKVRPAAAGGPDGGMMESDKPFRFETAHRPYEEMNCNACHSQWAPPSQTGGTGNANRNLIKQAVDDGLCQSCHKQVPAKLRYVHAPTAVNACLECHEAHNAPYSKLLSRPGNFTCFQCHVLDDLSEGRHHEAFGPEKLRNDPKHQCVSCHDPHHGKARFLLKPPKPKAATAAKPVKFPVKGEPGRPGARRPE